MATFGFVGVMKSEFISSQSQSSAPASNVDTSSLRAGFTGLACFLLDRGVTRVSRDIRFDLTGVVITLFIRLDGEVTVGGGGFLS